MIEVEGPRPALERLLLRLEVEKPPRCFIQSLESSWLDPAGYVGFEIRASEVSGEKTTLVLPDIATCPDCLREVFDSANRRYRYPFTNCTHCGPRFSILEALPYDRANTSMKRFTMCPQCQAEYDDPRDRRFHAQPNACPDCGPQLELWDRGGRVVASGHVRENEAESGWEGNQPRTHERGHGALLVAADAIRQGRIVAVKGLGGFHLIVAALDDAAVRRLRKLKHREEKPFALMVPTLAAVRVTCETSPLEERLLRSPEAPIVLLRRLATSGIRHPASGIAASVAPGNPYLGVMLPYTPLHHLLLAELGFPVVATSGNLSDEPICIDENEALERLGGTADVFLVHNRPIVRHVDDSIVRVMLGRELVLRRARGFAPLPITLKSEIRNPKSEIILAVGAHLKNTAALSVGPQVFISQHIGDLETEAAYDAFRNVIADLQRIYEVRPQIVAADLHPDYLSSKFAQQWAAPSAIAERSESRRQAASPFQTVKALTSSTTRPATNAAPAEAGIPNPRAGSPRYVGVQHHLAHVLACMAENEIEPPVLGVSWDGTGYGLDGTIWGGEFFCIGETNAERVAHLRTFHLPGGEAAVKEPRRTALGLLYEMLGTRAFGMSELPTLRAFSPSQLRTLKTMLTKGLNSPLTSSAGRLFDAIASLIGLRHQTRFEGQAAMELEFATDGVATDTAYEIGVMQTGTRISNPLGVARDCGTGACEIPASPPALVLDWRPMLEGILEDLARQVPAEEISARFHNALAEAVVKVARQVGEPRVVLSGGCFQNKYLTERTVKWLQAAGFRAYWHQRVPPNDGGIALGQVVAARRSLAVRR